MITAIEIENFKGIGERQRIEFAPLTLIFGANSSGKSTIVHALHYLREILASGNGDVDEIPSTDGELRLGGFENLVHRHDIDRNICIRIETNMREHVAIRSHISGLKRWLGEKFDGKVMDQIKNLGLEIEVGKADFGKLGIPLINRLLLILNGTQFADIIVTDVIECTDERTVAHVCSIDLDHPALTKIDGVSALRIAATKCGFEFANYDPDSGENLRRICESIGALPTLNSLNYCSDVVEDDDKDDSQIMESFLREFVISLVLNSTQQMTETLSELGHIGPIRDIPGRFLRKGISASQNSWYRGKAAWQTLLGETPRTSLKKLGSYHPYVSFHFDLQEAIGSPYRIERVGMWKADESEWTSGRHGLLVRSHLELVLRDLRTNTVVSIEDVGVGLSQVVPVLVGVRNASLPILYVEQPERHLHPKQQAMLGDVFAHGSSIKYAKESPEGRTGANQRRTIIVETHSELLILRLLRLVRETNLGVANDKGIKLTPRQLKVYYVGSGEEGTTFKEIQISDTGKFIQPWPDDFFELDFQERFA